MNNFVVISSDPRSKRADQVMGYHHSLVEAERAVRLIAEESSDEYYIFHQVASFKRQWVEERVGPQF